MSTAGATMVMTVTDYKSSAKPIWCPGCGDFGVLNGIYRAMTSLQLDPDQTVIVSGIGCSSRLPYFIKSYGFHSVHGRALPVATGVKLANPELTVVVVGGDGDGFSIGGGHIPHTAAENVDLTYIVMDNAIYGLTKGQPSPTSPLNFVTNASPYGLQKDPLNPVAMAITYGTSFVASGYSAQAKELGELILRGMKHRGFSLINVQSPCPTFNHDITYDTVGERVKPVPPEHDPTDRIAALRLAFDSQHVYTGVLYTNDRPTFEDKVRALNERASARPAPTIDAYFERYV